VRDAGGLRGVSLQPVETEAVSPAVFHELFLRGRVAVERDVPRRLQPNSRPWCCEHDRTRFLLGAGCCAVLGTALRR
jgi:hypothetical protein